MVDCPYCGSRNIEGDDDCAECGLSLSNLHLPMPASLVERSLLKDRVAILNPKTPCVVSPSTPVAQVLKLLVDRAIGCVLVVEGGRLVGIFSERDALLKINVRVQELAAAPISQFMTPQPQTLTSGAKIAFAVQRMDLGGYRHVPIVGENGRATGVISVRDILRYLTQKIADAACAGAASV